MPPLCFHSDCEIVEAKWRLYDMPPLLQLTRDELVAWQFLQKVEAMRLFIEKK